MKKVLRNIVIAGAATAMLASCSLTLPVAATSNSVGSKVGTATATGFFGFLFFGADASIQSAAKNGNISKISTVDLKMSNVLNILTNYECIVTGE